MADKASPNSGASPAQPSPAQPSPAQPSPAQPRPAQPRPIPAAAKPVAAGSVPAGKVSGAAGTVAASRGTKAVGVREEMIEREELGGFSIWMRDALAQTPSWLVSAVLHLILVLALAMLARDIGADDDLGPLVAAPGENEDFDELEELNDEDPLDDIDMSTDDVAFEAPIESEDVEIAPADEMEAAPMMVELSEIGLERAPRNDMARMVGSFTGDGLTDARGTGKGSLLKSGGGSPGSEKAVAWALAWLAEHQMPDGGWSFNHVACPRCNGQCRNAGSESKCRIAATSMALLPFLGAGQTHKKGKYRTAVNNGLYFLANRIKVSNKGGSLYEPGRGRMYSHGLAAITLCEAYAMTHDKGLHQPAQAVINYIAYAQDPVGGGWRYNERQKGDTSVVGWQIMALKSGHMAYLRVPPITIQKANAFLDSVQANSGANYGYTGPGQGQATTAIGLLCRMHLGWKKENPSLARGVEWISKQGPSPGNMYYNYYATQVMRHWEGPLWEKWNDVMRDQLVNTQAKNGHEKGSWHMGKGGDHGSKSGGRLYCTSMATMILEVYYRHLPIFQKKSSEQEFPE